MGHPDVKTIFQLEDTSLPDNPTPEQIKNARDNEIKNQKILADPRFRSLTTISGRTLTVWFTYEEDDKKIESSVGMKIPQSKDEEVIKNFIITKIEESIA